MKSLNRALSIITVSCVIAMQVCAPIYAAATASDADYTTVVDAESNDLINDLATSSDADSDFTVIELSDSFEEGLSLLSLADDNISLLSATGNAPTNYANTISYANCYGVLYAIKSGEVAWTSSYFNLPSSGVLSFTEAELIDLYGEDYTIVGYAIRVMSSTFPSVSGTYNLGFTGTFNNYTTGIETTEVRYRGFRSITYADDAFTDYSYLSAYDYYDGVTSFLTTIELPSNLTCFNLYVYTERISETDIKDDLSMSFSINLSLNTSDNAVLTGYNYSSTEYYYESTSLLSSVSDTLTEIVQTISDQLAALWDQIYNYQHLEDMANADANADKIVNALGNEITVQIDNDNSIANKIIDDADSNTDTIVNGYDSGTNDSTNDSFSAKSDEYDAIESEIFNTVSEPLESFTYDDYSFSGFNSSVLNAMRWVSNEFMELFNGMGDFNVPITCSLVLIVVTTLIGYYRIRAGG